MTGGAFLAELLVAGLIVLGSSFALVGSYGLLRLPSLMERLHGPTKATTLGIGAVLTGSVAYFQLVRGEWTTHEILVSLFLFITAPVSANMIAKVHLHQLRAVGAGEPGPAGPPPAPTPDSDWATYQAPLPGTADNMFEEDAAQ